MLWPVTPGMCAEVGVSSGSVYQKWMGFQPMSPFVGVDVSAAHVTNSFWWSSAQKSYVGNGWSLWEQGAVYFNHGAFGAGPAALVRYTFNSEFTKTSFYPSVALQYHTPKWRVEGIVHLRDQWTLNHGRGASIMVRRDLNRFTKQVGMALRAGVTILKFSDGLTCPYGTVLQFGIVVYHRPELR